MNYPINIEKENYHKAMLLILNFNLKLSKLEIDMLSILLKNNINVIDTEARDFIRKILNKDKFNTNNYIKRLKDKHIFIVKDNDKRLYINPYIWEIVKDKKVSFEFEIHDNN